MMKFSLAWRKHPLLYDGDLRNEEQRVDNLAMAKKIREAKLAMAEELQMKCELFFFAFSRGPHYF